MSRFKRLEDLEGNIDKMTADELSIELQYWRSRGEHMRGPAMKVHLKHVHRLERLLELKLRQENAD